MDKERGLNFESHIAMDARIRFETKDESNARREQAFLALSPNERFEWFLRSFGRHRAGVEKEERSSDNFIIRKRDHGVRG